MDDPKKIIRCPMCGKENDASAKRCTFCHAVLHEFDISEDVGDTSSSDDWLNRLRSGAGEESSQTSEYSVEDSGQIEPSSPTEEEAPDWLQRIRQRVVEDNTVPQEPAPGEKSGEEGIPDWLQGMMQEQEEKQEGSGVFQSEAANGQDSSDWLAQLRQGEEEVPLVGDENGLQADETGIAQPLEPGEIESRLSSLSFQQAESETQGRDGEELKPTTPLDAGKIETFSMDEAESLPSDLEAGEVPFQPEPFEEEVPEWLQKLQMAASGEPVEIPEDEGKLPDWLREFAPAEPGMEQEELQETLPAAESYSETEEPAPTFLEDFAAQQETAAEIDENALEEQPHGKPAEAASGEGWVFENIEGLIPEGQAVTPAEEEPELPDWLTSLNLETGDLAADTPMPFNEEEFPTWLEGIRSEGEDEIPAFLPDFESEKTSLKPSMEEGLPFEDGSTPDWLQDLSQPTETTGSEGLLNTQEDILPAELPTWLEAMKPDVTQKPSFTTQNVFQQEGPLAGMPEILPSQLFRSDFAEGYARGGKLKVTPEQQANADMIALLLKKMGDVSVLPSTGKKRAFDWLRPLFGILLIIAILIPLFLGGSAVTPAAMSASGEAAYTVLQSLEITKPVLVAFDFEPAYRGELSAAGAAVMQQLIQRNAKLVFLSTTPAGGVFADEFLQSSYLVLNPGTSSESIAAFRTAQTANLGYLPGSSASLQEFVQNPRQAARYGMNAALDGIPTWSLPALAGVDSLDDFALVLVLTDNSTLGRNWIEQVSPSLGSVPMVMVSSAAAAPMLLPYYDSKQIAGLVVGMADGSTYQERVLPGTVVISGSAALKAASGLAAIALLAGLVVFGWQALQANRIKE